MTICLVMVVKVEDLDIWIVVCRIERRDVHGSGKWPKERKLGVKDKKGNANLADGLY